MNKNNNLNLRIFGISYILSFAIVVIANFAIYNKIHISGNIDETINNLVSKEQFFRIAVLLDLFYVFLFSVAFTSLYMELKKVDTFLALTGIIMHLLYVYVFLTVTIQVLEVLRLVQNQIYVSDPDRFKQILQDFLGFRFDRYYGGLPFHSMGSFLFSYLIYKSGIISKPLTIFSMIAWGFCGICAICLYAVSGFHQSVNLWIYDVGATLSFIFISVIFIFKTKSIPIHSE